MQRGEKSSVFLFVRTQEFPSFAQSYGNIFKLLKLNSPNLVRTPSDAHIFLHFLSHFDKKK